jgi:hypothetical protein
MAASRYWKSTVIIHQPKSRKVRETPFMIGKQRLNPKPQPIALDHHIRIRQRRDQVDRLLMFVVSHPNQQHQAIARPRPLNIRNRHRLATLQRQIANRKEVIRRADQDAGGCYSSLVSSDMRSSHIYLLQALQLTVKPAICWLV